MGAPVSVIKRRGRRASESFQADKLRRSICAACLSMRTPEGQAEAIASDVTKAVVNWCADRPEVTSDDLRRVAADSLHTFHPEAAYLYKTHRAVI